MATPSAAPSPIARKDFSSSLHRRFLVSAASGGVLAILLLAGTAWRVLERTMEQRGDQSLSEATLRSDLVLRSAMDQRRRETDVLALNAGVIAAARQGNALASSLGLPRQDIPALEARYAADRSMKLAPDARLMLISLLPHLEAQQAILTDSNGYNTTITARSSDFVQSDEGWWQDAWKDGYSISDAAYDSASHASVAAIASVVRDGTARVGILKVKYDVTPLVASLASAGAGVRVDVLDSVGHVILSSDSAAMGSKVPGLPAGDAVRALDLQLASTPERAVSRPATASRWRIVAHEPKAGIAAAYDTARLAILGTTGTLLVVLMGLLFAMHRFLTRRITTPLGILAEAAEAVAAGDFSVQVKHADTDDEVGRTARAVAAMVLELRRLARAIAGSARETNAMSSEITAGTEEMAATAGEIAHTASDLSAQATHMAESIGALAGSAGSLRELAVQLEAGAQEGVRRNTTLRTLATENRAGLDASTESLDTLGNDVNASATAIEALAEASTEIRSFVTLVRKLARQSKLLALNAAMEAARAGAQGEGFAVVAGEVRRLAAMSSDAAERTESVVNGVLNGIEASRQSAGRAVAMAQEVRAASMRASASFSEVERSVADTDPWIAAIETTSVNTSQLSSSMTARLDELSGGTESFAAAMEEVAASSEEQSAATEEIAGAANTLVEAADRLNKLVGGLKLGDERPEAAPKPASPAADAPADAGYDARGLRPALA